MSGSEKCQDCGKPGARWYVFWLFPNPGEPATQIRKILCHDCRKSLTDGENGRRNADRLRFIASLDEFFEQSGVLEICAQCHAQGSGCCPASCRRLTPEGCSQKIVWCGTFLCSALLGALRECSPESARMFDRLKKEVGVGEWRLFELVSRLPAAEQDAERYIPLSTRYPAIDKLNNAVAIRPKLAALTDEILELRRAQHSSESQNIPSKTGGNCF